MILLSMALACSGETDLGECPTYIACAEATGTPTATLEATYGEEGLCWEESDEEQTLCRAACSDGMFGLAQLYPDEPACQGGSQEVGPDCGEIIATGDDVGSVPEDFTLVDQDGNDVSLYDYCDQAVLLWWAPLWEGGFSSTAADSEVLQTTYGDQGLQVLGLVFEDGNGDPATQGDVASVADSLGVSYPLLADPDMEGVRFEEDNFVPSLTLFGPGPEVLIRDDRIDNDDIEEALP